MLVEIRSSGLTYYYLNSSKACELIGNDFLVLIAEILGKKVFMRWLLTFVLCGGS